MDFRLLKLIHGVWSGSNCGSLESLSAASPKASDVQRLGFGKMIRLWGATCCYEVYLLGGVLTWKGLPSPPPHLASPGCRGLSSDLLPRHFHHPVSVLESASLGQLPVKTESQDKSLLSAWVLSILSQKWKSDLR